MTTNRTLDRVARFDERSRNFPIRAAVASNVFVKDKIWECNVWNDQGTEGACVGFGWSHELSAEPAVVPTSAQVAYALYKRAQVLDEWAGEAYDGTSVLAGAKAVKELKNNVGESYLLEYRWAFGLGDLLLALGHTGPVVLGLNWYQGMFDTVNGWITRRGTLTGGHCILAIGVHLVTNVENPTVVTDLDLDYSYIILHNSWGKNWGENGRAKISLRDMQKLLAEQGEACVPMVRNVDKVVVPVVPSVPTPAPAPVPAKSFYSVRRSNVFHGSHPGVKPFRTFDSYATALASGHRPCNTCRPRP